jgi:hypothetical protein
MVRSTILAILSVTLGVGLNVSAQADDPVSPAKAPKHKARLRMEEPMSTGMMKKGMMKGDVKAAAAQKSRKMQPAMEQEEKSMPIDKTVPKP